MRINRFVLALTLGTVAFYAESAMGQERHEMTRAEFEKIDSTQTVREREQVIQAQVRIFPLKLEYAPKMTKLYAPVSNHACRL